MKTTPQKVLKFIFTPQSVAEKNLIFPAMQSGEGESV